VQRRRRVFVTATLLSSAWLLTVACQKNRDEKHELELMRAQRVLQQQNETLVEKLIDGLNRQDTSVYALYAPDAKIYMPSAVAKPITPAEDLKATKNNWQGFPDLHFTIEEMVAEGNKLAVRLHVTGTQKNSWNGIPSAGRKVDMGSTMIVRIENGKITEQHEDADFLGLMTQLGMELRPANRR
jgi:predicted ester cyclase